MSELKPIEEGCLAITFNCKVPSNNGKIVTVVKHIGGIDKFVGNDYWSISEPVVTTKGKQVYHLDTKKLLRIDDPDLTEEEEESRVLVIDNTPITGHYLTIHQPGGDQS